MNALFGLGQILIAVALSVIAALLLTPTVYAVGSVLVTMACGGMLAVIAHERLGAMVITEESPSLLRTVCSILITSVLFGAMWPAVPFIYAWGAWRDRGSDA